jgi:folate-binding protein YgfZ
MPLYGRDISEQNLPQEVGRDDLAISFSKGCYLGQEIVARLDAYGHVNRLLRQLEFASETVPAVGAKLLADGQAVGQVTSAVWSPQRQAPIALGYVRRESAEHGSGLDTEVGRATVV